MQSHVLPNEVVFQSMHISHDTIDQPISDVDVNDAVLHERVEIEKSRTMPKWMVQTFHDSRLDAPLASHTCSSSHSASYTSNCYAFAVSSLCDEDEPTSFEEA